MKIWPIALAGGALALVGVAVAVGRKGSSGSDLGGDLGKDDNADKPSGGNVDHVIRNEAPMHFEVAKDYRDLPRTPGERGAPHGSRPWSQIVGITLHQTATRDFPANHSSLDHVPAHAMVHRDGKVSLLHHPDKLIYHGNALNGGTIGIEVAARAAGTEGDATTFWRSKKEREEGKTYAQLVAEATPVQLDALAALIRYYYEFMRANGGEINGIWAHRQGADDRGSDPGSRIWSVGEKMTRELGLKDRRDLVLGKGQPIPMSWRTDVNVS